MLGSRTLRVMHHVNRIKTIRPLPKKSGHPCLTLYHPVRTISFMTIPRLALAISSKRHRQMVLGGLGAATLLSSVLGPAVWIAVGGATSVFFWRLYKRAKNWWDYLSPTSSQLVTITERLVSSMSSHRATELVREEAIRQLREYFESADQGKQILEEFGLDHVKDLVWDDVYKSETTRLDKDGKLHQVVINFWLSDETSQGPKGGSCEVTASATVREGGKIHLDSLSINAPGWHAEEVIPTK